jgi:hypothetical protein
MPVNLSETEDRAKKYTAAWCSHVPEAVASYLVFQYRQAIIFVYGFGWPELQF